MSSSLGAAAAAAAVTPASAVPMVDLTNQQPDEAKPTATTNTPSSSIMTTAAAATISPLLDLTQEEEEEQEEEPYVLLTSLHCSIVGIRYYRGTAHPGEYVELVREPHNPYDGNAIRVDNMNHEKVGHIKREQAALLAPLMDRDVIKVDGTIPSPGNVYSMPVLLECSARASRADSTEVHSAVKALERYARKNLKQQHASASTRHATGRTTTAAAAAPPPVVHTRVVDWTQQQQDLDVMFDKQTRDQLANLPDMDMPTQLYGVTLYDYQKLGIRWLVHVETNNDARVPCFFRQVVEHGKPAWLCEITNCSQPHPPKPLKGALLADAMGLGKSIQTLGLILSNPPKGHKYPEGRMPSQEVSSSNDEEEKAREDGFLVEDSSSSTAAKLPATPNKTALRKIKLGLLQRLVAKAGLMTVGKKKADLVEACHSAIANGLLTGADFTSQALAELQATTITAAGDAAAASDPVCTLIVCPVSVMSNWLTQIETHVKQGVLRVAVYHGPDRHLLLPKVRNNEIDILIVSYQTLATEAPTLDNGTAVPPPKSKKPKLHRGGRLLDLAFHRTVLDEAHVVRSSKTRAYRAVVSLQAEHRLCLTGTPFVNRVDDIHSLLSFLRVEPFSDSNVFRRAITQPIQRGEDVGLSRLRTTMAHVALRRTKALAGIQLSSKVVELRLVEFPESGIHKTIHDTLFDTARAIFAAALQEGDGEALKNYTSILETLLRIRQACCSAKLVPSDRRENAAQVLRELQNRNGKPLSVDEGKALLEKLKGTFESAEAEVPECAVCLSEMEENDAIILRTCSHIYCELCISQVTAGHDSRCPLCRKPFAKADMVKRSAAASAAASTDEAAAATTTTSVHDEDIGPSPKVLALLEAIKEMQPEEKGVIFSQFTKFLDVIQQALEGHGHSFTRIDGSKSASDRQAAMKHFASTTDGPRFMLCSLHAAGTGINLTRANHIFMMDTWWNAACEEQAMDRVHRLGQTRPVRVVRFCMKESIEARIVKLQEAKSALGKGAMEKLPPEEKRKARITALKDLFLIGENKEEK